MSTAWILGQQGKVGQKVPNFAGTARRMAPVSRCPVLLPPGLHDPFNAGEASVTSGQFRLTGCWTGTLNGKRFTIDQYFGGEAGGGLAIKFGDQPIVRVGTGLGPPELFRFTGDTVCHAERAGARVVAVNIRTGSVNLGDDAEEICAPPSLPPGHVLGLPSGAPEHRTAEPNPSK
jgi:hypothetical protein